MATTIENLYVGDGSTVLYSFTFPYITPEDVEVSLAGTLTTEYTFANVTTIEFNTAPLSGVAIRIYRNTQVDDIENVFYPGSAIRAKDLNDNFTQSLFVIQEADINVGKANSNADAAVATANAAVVTANAAETSAAAAQGAATQAQTDATQAAADAASAQADATQAAADASAAQISADQANTAVQAAAIFSPVANVAAIPASPTDQDRVSVLDSTGISSFTPLTGLPVGPTYDSGVYVNLVYQTTGATWVFVAYGPNNPDSRYILDTANSVSTFNITNAAITPAKLDRPYVEKTGDTMTGDLTIANTADIFINSPAGSSSPATIVFFDADSTVGIVAGTAPLDSAYITGFGAYRCQNDASAHINLSKSSAITTSSPAGERVYIQLKRDDVEIGSCSLDQHLAGSGWFGNQVTWQGNLNGGLVRSKKIWNQRPGNFWTEGDYIGIGNSTGTTPQIFGSLCSAGSNGVSLCSNGFRNNSGGWTSYSSITGQSGGAEIDLHPNGTIIFYSDTNKSTSAPRPTERARFNNSGLTVSNLSGTGNRAVYSTAGGALTNSSSDVTLKTNVQTLDSQVNIVKALNPVSYNWIDTDLRGVQPEIGFIAQEVQELVPEVVGTNHNGTLSVDYPKLVATLTSALQEVLTRIETLEAKILTLENN